MHLSLNYLSPKTNGQKPLDLTFIAPHFFSFSLSWHPNRGLGLMHTSLITMFLTVSNLFQCSNSCQISDRDIAIDFFFFEFSFYCGINK